MTVKRVTLSEHELQRMVDEAANKAAREAVRETLITFGMDANNPLELQKDMQHLRDWRMAVGTIKKQSIVTAVGIITAGVLGAIWYMLRGGQS